MRLCPVLFLLPVYKRMSYGNGVNECHQTYITSECSRAIIYIYTFKILDVIENSLIAYSLLFYVLLLK